MVHCAFPSFHPFSLHPFLDKDPTLALSLMSVEEAPALASLNERKSGWSERRSGGGSAPFTFWKVLLYDARHCDRPSGQLADEDLWTKE